MARTWTVSLHGVEGQTLKAGRINFALWYTSCHILHCGTQAVIFSATCAPAVGLRIEYQVCPGIPHVQGGSISSLLSRFGRLSESVICVYTRQLLSGLAYLHAQRTVHRGGVVDRVPVKDQGGCMLNDQNCGCCNERATCVHMAVAVRGMQEGVACYKSFEIL